MEDSEETFLSLYLLCINTTYIILSISSVFG